MSARDVFFLFVVRWMQVLVVNLVFYWPFFFQLRSVQKEIYWHKSYYANIAKASKCFFFFFSNI